jgi:hypothetical protein
MVVFTSMRQMDRIPFLIRVDATPMRGGVKVVGRHTAEWSAGAPIREAG